jgi:hypothetical protein
VSIKGNRYMFGGETMPAFLPFLKEHVHVEFDYETPKQADIDIPAANVNHAFVEELGVLNLSRRSFEKWDRITHSHGHTF